MCESFELTEGFLFMPQEPCDLTEPVGLVMNSLGEYPPHLELLLLSTALRAWLVDLLLVVSKGAIGADLPGMKSPWCEL